MSLVTTLRSTLNTMIEALLPGYVKLSDSIDIDDNPNIYLQKGYRVAYGPAENIDDDWCMGAIRRRREFTVVLTNAYVANLDADEREAAEDALFDDQDTLVKAIHKDPELTGTAIVSDYRFDNGLEYLIDQEQEKQYIMISTSISIDYYEEIP